MVEAAKKRKYVLKEGNKTVIRDYSYVDRAIHMYRHNKDTHREDIHEEAVAEMFRDYADGKLVLVARPKNIFDKITKAIQTVFSAHQENNLLVQIKSFKTHPQIQKRILKQGKIQDLNQKKVHS